MNFTSLHAGTSCNCLTSAEENITNTFARRVGKAESVKESDFRSYFERGKLPTNSGDCDEVCGYKGISIDIFDQHNRASIIAKTMLTVEIGKKLKHNLCIFQMKSTCGMVKHTPNQPNGYNEYHYDLYKSDEFNASLITPIEFIPLTQ